jgi:hypothetical protein
MWTLDEVIEVLHREGIRATYGAVAGVVGGNAMNIMTPRERNQLNSWVVAADTNLPTGYTEDQLDPRLTRLPIVLDTTERLQRLLDRQVPLQ